MKVGILELLLPTVSRSVVDRAYTSVRRCYYSIMPQAISVWCRQLGHDVTYATYYGQEDPIHLLPDDLDVVFMSTYTQTSALAYALAKVYRSQGTLTVLGGPHARGFPDDTLRFFDLAVGDCDRKLIEDILRMDHDRPSALSSDHALTEFPSVEERMPEIRIAAFDGQPFPFLRVVSLLASVGCPYTCDFCTDWNSKYVLIPEEQLVADLRYISKNMPGVKVLFHDPNFGVNFDKTLGALESIPPEQRNPYAIESSLSLLRKTDRLARLRDTNCIYLAPGVESWGDYSGKAGTGVKASGQQKFEHVVEHFNLIYEYVPNLHANFILGGAADAGEEPVRLTEEFMYRLPYVWSYVNIPQPYAGTPLYDNQLEKGEILEDMPFSFYGKPYMVTPPPNYEPEEYYSHLVRLTATEASPKMLGRRLVRGSKTMFQLAVHIMRTTAQSRMRNGYRQMRDMLGGDAKFRAFHYGESRELPEFFHWKYEKMLGRYAELLSREDRKPVLRHSAESALPSRAPLNDGTPHVPQAPQSATSDLIPIG